jgi:hypothetical protein
MTPSERRLEDYLAAGNLPGDRDAHDPASVGAGTDVRHDVPEHVTITCYPRASHHPMYWTAVWWHATGLGFEGKDMIIEQSGDIESERPDEAIAWAEARCADIRIATPTSGGYVPLAEYLG